MNTPIFKFLVPFLVFSVLISGCKKDEPDSFFDVNNIELLPPNAGKDKLKTTQQYVSILYTNLFQEALSPSKVYEISLAIESVGDFDIAREVLISNFMNKPGVQLPTEEEMNTDLEAFITETYNRFLVRNPTEAEITWFENYISSNPNIKPEIVYFSFALCDEYMYY